MPAETIGQIGTGTVTLIVTVAILAKLALNDIVAKIKGEK